MAAITEKILSDLMVPPGQRVDLLRDYDPGYTPDTLGKADAEGLLERCILRLSEQQEKLYAQDTYALLMNLQAMDAAGKDSTIKHVMSGVNPQGVQVTSFKVPSPEELDHDYLWRSARALPARGNIGIFNRSYYEEVLVVRVHPEFLERQKLPARNRRTGIWKRRFEEINNFERYLTENGIVVLKIFLNVSKEEQKKRFLDRVSQPEKNWKFSASDILERKYWDAYMEAYGEMFSNTSTRWAPWYIIPADHKWFTRLAVISVISHVLDGLGLDWPEISAGQREALLKAKEDMESEGADPGQPGRKKKKKRQGY